MKPRVVERAPFRLETREVWRLLGYPPSRGRPTPLVLARIEEMIEESRALIEPRACYTVTSLHEVPAEGPFRGAEQIAFSVSTIGGRLEGRVAELARRGETLRALVLDAIGSATVESVTDGINAEICRDVGQAGVFTNRRISPGYRGWPISGQAEIFALLPSRLSGVRLTPTLFMEPRKSISAAVSIGRRVAHSKYVSICGFCDRRDCAYRRDSRSGSGEAPHASGSESIAERTPFR
ncbi:MAG TPA: hypothetical protein VFM88_20455 [Vicinamibacteria bacterium]|nr:hypothetical protein [Vicinamibacteria bacterium]